MKRALVLLAEGCEEMEAVIVVDMLRRAGWTVVAAGIVPGPVTASRQVRLLPDLVWTELADPMEFDVLVLPGGVGGTERLAADAKVLRLVRRYAEEPSRWLACICAAARVLGAAGVLKDQVYTCYPGVQKDVQGGQWVDEPVVVSGRLITSQGPATAMAFALRVVRELDGRDAAVALGRPMLLQV